MSKYHVSGLVLGEGDNAMFSVYELETHGDTREELLANATVSETDQDGGEMGCWGHDDFDCPEMIERAVDRLMAGEKELAS